MFAFATFAELIESWMLRGITDANYIAALYDAALNCIGGYIMWNLTRLDTVGVADSAVMPHTSSHGETITEYDIYFGHHGQCELTLYATPTVRYIGHLPVGLQFNGFTLQQDLMLILLEQVGGEDEVRKLKADGKSALSIVREECVAKYTEF